MRIIILLSILFFISCTGYVNEIDSFRVTYFESYYDGENENLCRYFFTVKANSPVFNTADNYSVVDTCGKYKRDEQLFKRAK